MRKPLPPAPESRPVVVYVRVSTSRQAEEGVSLAAQEERSRAWAVANGHTVASVHVDAGLSGGRADNRPGLQAALSAACKSRGVLVVYSLSRLARSTRDAIEIGARLDKAGADLVFLTERIDTTSAAGRLFFRLLASFAEFERDLVSERTLAAMDFKRRAGDRISRHVPFGWNDDGNGKLVPVASEQRVLRRMLAWRAEGTSLRGIAAKLAEHGVKTKTGLPTWTAATVRSVLLRAEALGGGA